MGVPRLSRDKTPVRESHERLTSRRGEVSSGKGLKKGRRSRLPYSVNFLRCHQVPFFFHYESFVMSLYKPDLC